MYNRIYRHTFTGSLCGKGPIIQLVWAHILAATGPDHTVALQPITVAAMIGGGTTPEDVQAAIDVFCAPDPESRNKDHEGRKLLPLGQWEYLVTGHQGYHGLKDREALKKYNRQKQQEFRARKKAEVAGTSTATKSSKPRQRREEPPVPDEPPEPLWEGDEADLGDFPEDD